MRVLLISQYFPPEGTTLVASIAEHLKESGHQVQVLTGFPNYPDGVIFPGYKQSWRKNDLYKDIPVLRVPLYANHSANPVARMVNYISFALSSSTAFKEVKDVDIIYVYAAQMTPAFGPWIWKKFGGPPYVLHVQDLWPDSIIGSSLIKNSKINKLVDLLISPWLRNVYQNSSAIIGIAPTMVKTLISRGGSSDFAKLVYNWSSDSLADSASKKLALNRDVTNILFAGNVGDMQDLETVIRAAKLVEGHSIKITIMGDGVALPRIQALAEQLNVKNVHFGGRVPRREMAAFYRKADFALVTLKDLPTFRGTIPSKFQASLAHGLPIITTVQGDLRQIVQEFGVGIVADAENVESLATAFISAAKMSSEDYEKVSKAAVVTYKKHFSKESALNAIQDILVETSLRKK